MSDEQQSLPVKISTTIEPTTASPAGSSSPSPASVPLPIPLPQATGSNVSVLVTIFGMTLTGLGAIVAIFMVRPDVDNSGLVIAVLGFIAPTTAALLAFLKSQHALVQAQQTHLLVNSRMDEFKKALQTVAGLRTEVARADGLAEGRIEGRDTANTRTDSLAKKKAQ